MLDKRRFFRHPANIPLEIWQVTDSSCNYETLCETLKDISLGGLQFSSTLEWKKDTLIYIQVPLVETVFKMVGRVVWCERERHGEYFDIGVEFIVKKEDSEKKHLVVEQVCQIEAYQRIIREFKVDVSNDTAYPNNMAIG